MVSYPQPGDRFGRYDIVRRIGRGGMGVVYAAVHRDLERDVALKLLSHDLSDSEEYRRRFVREARVLARLDSRYIVRVFDAGEEDGWLFIATELVPDGDLGDLVREEGALPPDRAIDIMVQVAEGLADAHELGILHRDIKPSNVLIQRGSDGAVRAILCDLGISAVLDSEHTKTLGVIGTLAYMAPERHEGGEATAASDIYALGCMLWALLDGQPPYVGTDYRVANGHLNDPIPQQSGRSPLVESLNELVRMTMAKNPADRPASAREFAAILRAVPGVGAGDDASASDESDGADPATADTILKPSAASNSEATRVLPETEAKTLLKAHPSAYRMGERQKRQRAYETGGIEP